MSDLRAQVDQCAGKLHNVFVSVSGVDLSKTLLPAKCYDIWTRRSKLYAELSGTLDLFDVRDEAWKVLTSLTKDTSATNPLKDEVRYGSHWMSFSTARHLALTSYVGTSWAVYDRLTSVCGCLIGHLSIGNNELPGSRPRLVEHFIREGSERNRPNGFSLGGIIPPAYAWPAAGSYTLRNWLLHDGFEVGFAVFAGKTLEDGFELSESAKTDLMERCSKDRVDSSKCCLYSEGGHLPDSRDLLALLDMWHSELDEMFCSLLQGSVDAFVAQVTLFAARDEKAFRRSFTRFEAGPESTVPEPIRETSEDTP